MRYVSLFSGIEAATVAWEPLGWEPLAFCEIDAFPSAVLAHRFPNVPNLGDITKVEWKEHMDGWGAVDVVIGGSPCQSFSIAGGRESLDGESRLMFEYIRAVREIRPRWLVWENVPGVFSTKDNAFGQLLDELEDLGYCLAWRTLDAQFFGVAQRRRRVFLVGYAGGMGGEPAAVLFERDSLRGNTVPSREKREELSRTAGIGAKAGGFKHKQGAESGGVGYAAEQSPTLVCGSEPAVLAFDEVQVTSPDNGSSPQFGGPCHSMTAPSTPATLCLQTDHLAQNGTNVSVEVAKTLDTASGVPVVCMTGDTANAAIDEDMAGTLHAGGGVPVIASAHCAPATGRASGSRMPKAAR